MRTRKRWQCLVLTLIFCLVTGCARPVTPAAPSAAIPATPMEAVGLANPASVFCEEQGGRVDIRTESRGEVGYCIFPDGSECEEWAFYRGECVPGASVCHDLAGEMEQRLGVPVQVTFPAPFQDPLSGQSGEGCQALATATGVNFESLDVPFTALREMFEAQGWQADSNYDGGGPTGLLGGYRQDSALCLWLVEWTPAEDANCPDDQPISLCELAPEQKLYTVMVNCASK